MDHQWKGDRIRRKRSDNAVDNEKVEILRRREQLMRYACKIYQQARRQEAQILIDQWLHESE